MATFTINNSLISGGSSSSGAGGRVRLDYTDVGRAAGLGGGFTTDDAGDVTITGASGLDDITEISITGIGGSQGAADADTITFDLSTFADSFSIAVTTGSKAPSADDCIVFDGADSVVNNGGGNWTVTYTNGGETYTLDVFAGAAGVKAGGPPPSTEDDIVDGEDTGEEMILGYNDDNDPTDGGGDMITNDADLIYGNGGNDTIDGAGGNDTIFGDNPHDAGQSTREIFQWGDAPGFGNNANAGDFTQDTGSANITFDIVSTSGSVQNLYETTTQNTDDLDPAVSENESFESIIRSNGGEATYKWSSDVPIENVEFRVNDADGDAVVKIRAYDENGDPIEVVLSDLGSGLAASDTDTVAGNDQVESTDNNYTSDSAAEHSFLVTIPGPVSSWEIIHEQDGNDDTGINITDIAFDVPAAPTDTGDDIISGGDGDDIIDGGFGNDTISGDADDDTIIASSGTDQVDGGEGRDTYDAQEAGAGDFPAGINGPGGSGGGSSFPAPNPATHEVFTFEIADDDDDLSVKDFSASSNGSGAQDFTITDNNDDDLDKLTIKGNGGSSGDGDNDIFRFDLSGFNDDFTVELKSEDTSDQVVFTNVSSRTDNPDGSVTINYTGSDGQPHTVTVEPGDATVITDLGSGGGGGTGSSGGSTLGAETIEVIVDDNGDGTVEKVNDGTTDTVTSVENFVAGEAAAEADSIELTTAVEEGNIATDIQGIDQVNAVGTYTPEGGGATVNFGPGGTTLADILNGPTPGGTYTITGGDEDGQIGDISFANFETIQFTVAGTVVVDANGIVDGEETSEEMNPGYDDSNDPTDGGGDQIDGDDGDNDSIRGNAGNDTIDAGLGDDTVDGGADNDTITGNVGNDIVLGGTGNDTLDGGEGDDTILGGDDRDSIIGSAGEDVVDGGDGGDDFDTLDLRGLGPVGLIYTTPDEEDGIAIIGNTGEVIRFQEIEQVLIDEELDPDGIVEGTFDADDIELLYDGDPNGDFVDNNDALLPGEVGNDDIIIAKTGDDTVASGEGDDDVFAGEGNDIVSGEAGNDRIFGDEGDDLLEGNQGDDSILGGEGNDTLDAGGGNDTLDGEEGDDLLTGNPGNDVLRGGDGNDTLIGNDGTDVLEGGAGNDTISTGPGEDTVSGGDDRDTIIVVGQDDQFVDGNEGGDDFDTLQVVGNAEVEFDPMNGENGTIFYLDDSDVRTGVTTTFINIENVVIVDPDIDGVVEGDDNGNLIDENYVGDPEGDRIDNFDSKEVFLDNAIDDLTPSSFFESFTAPFRADQRDAVDGGGGNDTIFSRDGDDIVDAGSGDDFVDGGLGFDDIAGREGNDTLDGGAGDDKIFGGDDDDLLIGGIGADTLLGGDGSDTLQGGVGNNLLDAGLGDDLLIGGENSDTLDGGEGNDTIIGGFGTDSLEGGAGDDVITGNAENTTAFGALGNTPDVLSGGTGNDILDGSSGNDSLSGDEDNDSLYGGTGDDTLDGGTGDDFISGDQQIDVNTLKVTFPSDAALAIEPSNDLLEGGEGNDTLDGGKGADVVNAGADDDTIISSDGADTVDGGTGRDTYLVQEDTSGLFPDADASTHEVSTFNINEADEEVEIEDDDRQDVTFTDGTGVNGTDSLEIEFDEADNSILRFDLSTFDDDFTIDLKSEDANDQVVFFNADSSTTLPSGDIEITYTGSDNATHTVTIDPGKAEVILADTAPTIETVNVEVDDDGDGTVFKVDDASTDTITSVENYVAGEAPAEADSITLTDPIPFADIGTEIQGIDDSATGTFTPANGGAAINFGPGGTTLSSILSGPNPAGDYAINGGDENGQVGNISFENFEFINFSIAPAPADGVVDGEETGELMDPGYNDNNSPTDGGGDQIDGTDGNDDSIEGNGGNDTIDSGLGNDTVDGGSGDDVFDIDEEGNGIDDDVIIGGETGETTGDVIDTQDIDDDLTVDFSAPETGTITDGDDTTSFSEIEELVLGGGDDVVNGSDGDENVDGGGGNDVFDGGGGDDSFVGGAGNDTLIGDEGNDTLEGGADDDEYDGGDGNDVIVDTGGDNLVNTGGTTDPLPDAGFPGYGPIPAVPADSDPDNDRDSVTTGGGNDTINTGDDADTINSGAGNDLINAGIDNDFVDAGDDNDIVVGSQGEDTLLGGEGDDTIYGGLGITGVELAIRDDDDILGPDPDPNDNRDSLVGGAGNDVLLGEDDADTLEGGTGNDSLFGGVDNDDLSGDEGSDTLEGGHGRDTLDGGADDDVLTGGTEDDVFVEVAGDGADTITDFGVGNSGSINDGIQTNNDFVDLSQFYNPTTVADVNANAVNPANNFSDALSMLRADAEDGVLDGNINGEDLSAFIGDINLTIENGGNAVTGSDLTFDNTNVACFVRGTQIATRRGSVPIEELKAGDEVITMDHGFQKIRWIGSTSVPAEGSLAPVVIRKGAMGNERDLRVSPQHRMLVRGWHVELMFGQKEALVPAKALINDETVFPLEGGTVDYFHMMFDRHELVYAEGIPSESFHPGHVGIGSFAEDTREEILSLFPQLREDAGAYSEHVRPSLKVREAKVLAENPELMK